MLVKMQRKQKDNQNILRKAIPVQPRKLDWNAW